MIGTRAAATAIPDGYTLVMSTSGTTSINPSLYANPGYDMLKGTSNNVRGHKFGLGPVFDCLPGLFFRPLLRLEHCRRLHPAFPG